MSDPQSLAELLELARELRRTNSKACILDTIAEICAAADLHLGYDGAPFDDYRRAVVHAPTTKYHYFQRLELDIQRIILFPIGRESTNPLNTECNGVVIDTNEWRTLALPPPAFNRRPRHQVVDNFLKDSLYEITPIYDGTIITIYHWKDGIWCLSTAQGHDVSERLWMGPETYAETVHRLLPASVDRQLVDGHLSFPGLDPSYSYTIGFRSHHYQPLLADPERVWDIQQSHLDSGTATFDRGFTGATAPRIQAASIAELKRGECLEAAPSEFCYGYTLRSTDPRVTGAHSHIILDTDLLRFIRRTMYRQPALKKALTHKTRLLHQVIRAILTPRDTPHFLRLYPQFAKYKPTVENLVTAVIDDIIQIHRAECLHQTPGAPSSPQIRVIAQGILGHIKRNCPRFQAHNDEARTIVRSYVLQPDTAILLLPIVASQ